MAETVEGIVLVDYRNNLPISILPKTVRHWAYRIQARKLSRLLDPAADNILWSFCPTPVVLSNVLKSPGTRLIYHVVDPYHTFAADLAASTTILLGLLLIPHWGIIGAAFVSSVAYIVQFAVQCAIVRFRMKITLKDMFFLQSTDFVRIRALIGNRLPFLSK